MTDAELKKLSRSELLEMLLVQTKEVERLQKQLARTEQKLASQKLNMEKAGSIAQAALELNGVFDAAQRAADQYLENVRTMESSTRKRCEEMERSTREQCDQMIRDARRESSQMWETIRDQIKDPFRDHMWWIKMMKDVNSHIDTNE